MNLGKTYLTIRTLLFTSFIPMNAQQTTFKKEFLKKWRNATNYTIKVAKKMPADLYSYKPTADIRTFGEQIEHIGMAMIYLSKSAVNVKETEFRGDVSNKEEVIQYLKDQFAQVQEAIENMVESKFDETVTFWAGIMTRRKILSITYDHTTHHRAQAIVYLRMNGIIPPDYISW